MTCMCVRNTWIYTLCVGRGVSCLDHGTSPSIHTGSDEESDAPSTAGEVGLIIWTIPCILSWSTCEYPVNILCNRIWIQYIQWICMNYIELPYFLELIWTQKSLGFLSSSNFREVEQNLPLNPGILTKMAMFRGGSWKTRPFEKVGWGQSFVSKHGHTKL